MDSVVEQEIEVQGGVSQPSCGEEPTTVETVIDYEDVHIVPSLVEPEVPALDLDTELVVDQAATDGHDKGKDAAIPPRASQYTFNKIPVVELVHCRVPEEEVTSYSTGKKRTRSASQSSSADGDSDQDVRPSSSQVRRLPKKKRKTQDIHSETQDSAAPMAYKPGRRSTLQPIVIDRGVKEMLEQLERDKLAPYVGEDANFNWLFPDYKDCRKIVKSFLKVGISKNIKKAANGSFSTMDEMLMIILVLWHDSVPTSATPTFWREMMVKGYLVHHTESSLVGRWKRAILPHLSRFPAMPKPLERALQKLASR